MQCLYGRQMRGVALPRLAKACYLGLLFGSDGLAGVTRRDLLGRACFWCIIRLLIAVHPASLDADERQDDAQ